MRKSKIFLEFQKERIKKRELRKIKKILEGV